MKESTEKIRSDNLSSPDLAAFAARLAMVMKTGRVTQAALAAMSGISQSRISDWLAGKSKPQPRSLHSLALALGVEQAWLAQDLGQRLDGDPLSIRTDEHICRLVEHQGGGNWRDRALNAEGKLQNIRAAVVGLLTLIDEPAPKKNFARSVTGNTRLRSSRKDHRANLTAMARLGILGLVDEATAAQEIDPQAARALGKAIRKKLRDNPPVDTLSDQAQVSIGLYECSAGGPLSPANRLGNINVPANRWPAKALFALKLNGDSMDKAKLNNGDVVLCVWSECREPEAGDIVVAHLRGDGCTLKRLHGPEGKRWLEPESTNPVHQRIELDGEGEPQAVIQAVMIGKF